MLKMKALTLAVLVGLCAAASSIARAAEKSGTSAVVKVDGYLVKVETTPDGKSAVATLLVKGKRIPILVQDELTMKKFKIKKIRTDDEIKCSYKTVDGKNVSVKFLRAAGC